MNYWGTYNHDLMDQTTTLHKSLRQGNTLAKYILNKPIKAQFFVNKSLTNNAYYGRTNTYIRVILKDNKYYVSECGHLVLANVDIY